MRESYLCFLTNRYPPVNSFEEQTGHTIVPNPDMPPHWPRLPYHESRLDLGTFRVPDANRPRPQPEFAGVQM